MKLLSILLALAALRQSSAAGLEHHGWDNAFDTFSSPLLPEQATQQTTLGGVDVQYIPAPSQDHLYGQFQVAPTASRSEHLDQHQHQQLPYYPYPNHEDMLAYDHSGASSASDLSYDYENQWQGDLPHGADLMQMYLNMNNNNMGHASSQSIVPPSSSSSRRRTSNRPPRSRVPRGTFGSSSSSSKEKATAKASAKHLARFAEEDAAAASLRTQIGQLWERKGLWVGMQPREMAAGIAEIKLAMGKEVPGAAAETGPILAQHIREHPDATKEYAKQVSDWGKKYMSRMRRLTERFEREKPPLRSEQERNADIFKYIRFVKSRQEYRDLAQNKDVGKDEATKIKREAGIVWEALLEHTKGPGISTIDDNTPMHVIEEQSRYIFLFLEPFRMDEVADYIRFYLMHVFHKTPEQIDEFNKARNDWLKAAHIETQKGQEQGEDDELLSYLSVGADPPSKS